MIRLAINGAAGRMGTRLVALSSTHECLKLVAALDHVNSPHVSQDSGRHAGIAENGIPITAAATVPFDVLIDFSSPTGMRAMIDLCTSMNAALVVGTTGLSTDEIDRLQSHAAKIPILRAANMSVGVNVLLRVVADLTRALGGEFDIEISETHHRFKADAPSGTAMALLDAIRSARGGNPDVVHGRSGITGTRPSGEIGVHALRLGDTVGEHSVQFGSLGETITISHSAHNRDVFASGALRAACWIHNRPPALYSMRDVLFGTPL